jgi:hypothetical protein
MTFKGARQMGTPNEQAKRDHSEVVTNRQKSVKHKTKGDPVIVARRHAIEAHQAAQAKREAEWCDV